MRAGIQSIPRGQVYAGQAVGMTYGQNMKLVILPQAFRNMLPVLLTQTIILFQDTSLVYAIGAYDLLKGFETAGKNFGRPIEAYLLAAVVYFIMCYALVLAGEAPAQEDRHHPLKERKDVRQNDRNQERFQVVWPGAGAQRLLGRASPRATWWWCAGPRARASPR